MADIGNHGHNSAGIMVFGTSDNNTIENNSVDCSYPDGSAKNIYNAYGTKAGDMDDDIWKNNFGSNCATGFMAMGNSNDTNYTYRGTIYQNIIINTDNFMEQNHGGIGWTAYNNTFYNGQYFIQGAYYDDYSSSVVPKEVSSWNNIIYAASSVYLRQPSQVNWQQFFTYTDYNQAYNTSYWASYNWGSSQIALSSWQSAQNFDIHSITTNPNFLNNASSTWSKPEDFKRSSYPEKGRGTVDAGYEKIIGAYITGTETIGYTEGSQSSDTIAPASPQGLSVN